MVSEDVAGPQESSDGREEIISAREIGAMIATGVEAGMVSFGIVGLERIFVDV